LAFKLQKKKKIHVELFLIKTNRKSLKVYAVHVCRNSRETYIAIGCSQTKNDMSKIKR
jgi:hypothetical protein